MKSILITGGTGSIGQTLVRSFLKDERWKRIVVYSRDEFKQYQMVRELGEFPGGRLRFVVGDVRNLQTLTMATRGIDVIIHTAALKQVPSCEYNPWEAVQTNVTGAWNVINAALENGVKRTVALSTDKAVNPVNLYGATKLVAEKLFVDANVYGRKETKFSVVRYGNVLASRGSVLQLFREQAKDGVVKITSYGMSRFWWTLGMAVDFIRIALEEMKGGEVFVPVLKSTMVVDLAKVVCPECSITATGIRPGEKLFETLISPDEVHKVWDLGWAYCVNPDNPFFTFEGDTFPEHKVRKDFVYTSVSCLSSEPHEFLRSLLKEMEER